VSRAVASADEVEVNVGADEALSVSDVVVEAIGANEVDDPGGQGPPTEADGYAWVMKSID